jgi:hypothetical protein
MTMVLEYMVPCFKCVLVKYVLVRVAEELGTKEADANFVIASRRLGK